MGITNRLRLESLETRLVPAAEMAYALPLTGLPGTAVTHMAADPAGNTYVTGTFTGTVDLDPDPKVQALVAASGTDVFVAKYGSAGQLLWYRTLKGQADESAADIAVDGIGNVYVAGTFKGAVDFDPSASRTAVATADDGGSAYLWKLSPNGTFVMARTVDGPSVATGLAVDLAGNTLVAGTFTGSIDFDPDPNKTTVLAAGSTAGSGFLWKLDQPGRFVWAKGFQTTGTIQTSVVALDGQGNAYLSGRFTGTADLDPGPAKAQIAGGIGWTPFVVKLGRQGDYLWGRSLRPLSPTAGAENAITGLGVDGIGNVYAAGTIVGSVDFDPGPGTVVLASTGSTTDGFVWKLTPQGSMAYARKFGGTNAETVADLFVDKPGNAYITGTFTGVGDFDPGPGVVTLGSGSGATDGYVLKLTPQGGLAYARALGGGSSTTKPTTIFADGAGNMYLSGTFVGRADFNPGPGTVVLAGGNGSGFLTRLYPTAAATPRGPVDRPPTNLSAGGPHTIYEGDGLKLKASGVDPEKKPLTYSWDLNGDGVFGDALGANVTLNPNQMARLGLDEGTGTPRTIRVRIGDGVNLPVEATATLTILNLAPTGGRIKSPEKIVEGVRPDLSVVGVTDVSRADRLAGFRYSWDFNDDGVWDLGDGSTFAGSVKGVARVPAQFVRDSGPLAVRVRVFDKDGGYQDLRTTLIIEEVAPTATFQVVGNARSGRPTLFAFTNVKDSPADTEAGFTYAFDLNNDGTWDVVGKNPQAQVTFPFRGVFTVRGLITDADGMSSEYVLTVNVPF